MLEWPRKYHVVLHSNSDEEPTTAVVCFLFSCRLKSQHALKVPRTSWGYTVVELKPITRESTNQSRAYLREPNMIGRAKTKGCRMIPGHSSTRLFHPFSCPSARFSSTSTLECPFHGSKNRKDFYFEGTVPKSAIFTVSVNIKFACLGLSATPVGNS